MYNLKKLVKAILDKIGGTAMGTTATTITGAIAEHEQEISDLNSNLTPILYTGYTFVAYSPTDPDLSYVYIIGKICIFSLVFVYGSDYTPTDTQDFINNMPKPKHNSYLQGLVFTGTKMESFRCRIYANGNVGTISNFYSKVKTTANNPAIITGCYVIE